MEKPISELATACKLSFATLREAAAKGLGLENSIDKTVHTKEIYELCDRYAAWAGNLGALQSPKKHSSLDYRLRETKLVRSAISDTLRDLHSSLQKACDILNGVCINRISTGLSELLLANKNLLSEFGLSSSVITDSGQTSELRENVSIIKQGVDGLFRAAIFIKKFSSINSRREKAARTTPFDATFDIMRIQDLHPGINLSLATRLGEANARRRQYLKYRQDHAAKLEAKQLSEDLSLPINNAKEVSNQIEEDVPLARTAATLLSGTEATTFIPDYDTLSVFRRPPSVMSTSTTATSIVEFGDEELQFPPLPAEARSGNDFFCPYCMDTVQGIEQESSERQERKWRQHIIQDLEPYTCTFVSCKLETFAKQTDWFNHELMNHRGRWVCRQCSLSFFSPAIFKEHILECDSVLRALSVTGRKHTTEEQLEVALERSKRSLRVISSSECPFCPDSSLWVTSNPDLATSSVPIPVSVEDFRKHVGRHLLQLALFVLPRSFEETDDEAGDEDDTPSTYSAPDSVYLQDNDHLLRDSRKNSADSYSKDAPTYEDFVTEILVLYPKLEQWLIDRIANEQCKRYKTLLEYRKKHEAAVREGGGRCPNGDKCQGENPSFTEHGKSVSTMESGSDAARTTQQDEEEDDSGVESGSDAARTAQQDEEEDDSGVFSLPAGIPVPPVGSFTNPVKFECPICFKLKKFGKPSDWSKHVHEDLQPFTCTYRACTNPRAEAKVEPKSFKRKADWVRHENEKHRKLEWWTCVLQDCNHICYRRDNFLQHLVREHRMSDPKQKTQKEHGFAQEAPETDRTNQLVNDCRQETVRQPTEEPCLFCGQISNEWKKLHQHLGTHMEQLALPVLELVMGRIQAEERQKQELRRAAIGGFVSKPE